jgi:DNA processing protein
VADPGKLDAVARLRLIRSENVGPISYRQLVQRFGSAGAALEAIPALAARGGGHSPRLATAAVAEAEIETVARLGARHVFIGDADYPLLLAETEGAPPVLIAAGDIGLLQRGGIAMVGARNASAAACRFARQLAAQLGNAGQLIVSGLARGIDTAAHEGSIGTGTIAVIAGGIDSFYPQENQALQRAIAEQGLVVAEQRPGTEPMARHFPRRNRIIAGLTQGTVVVEAAPRSGSLITARQAADYGREVMAVPGSPLDPRAQGCNLLIREGATLVQTAEDVLEAITPIAAGLREPGSGYSAEAREGDASDADRARVAAMLNATPVPVDEVIRQAELPASAIHVILLELELAGRLERHAGGKISLIG